MSKTVTHPRSRLMHTLAQEGWPLQKIGDAMGHISKQRVSQCIHEITDVPIDPHRNKVDMEEVIRVCETACSFEDAAKKLGISTQYLQRILFRVQSSFDEYKRLFRKKRTYWHKRRLILLMRFMAKKLGHTPSIKEITIFAHETRNRKKPIPYHTAWSDAFGSMSKATAIAGLTPNKRGFHRKAVSS